MRKRKIVPTWQADEDESDTDDVMWKSNLTHFEADKRSEKAPRAF